MSRQVNAKGLALIKSFEGLRLTAYLCPAGVWTIGYGHTGPDVYEGLTITPEQADDFLRRDIMIAEDCVAMNASLFLNDNQFSALVSFVFNVGVSIFQHSTLLRCLNAGDIPGAAEQILVWHHVHGQDMPGLKRRRQAERDLFLEPVIEQASTSFLSSIISAIKGVFRRA